MQIAIRETDCPIDCCCGCLGTAWFLVNIFEDKDNFLNGNACTLERANQVVNDWLNRPRVGHFVRSYDFPGRDDCYIEGLLLRIGPCISLPCEAYHIRVTKDVCEGEEISGRQGLIVTPPLNGTPRMSGGICKDVMAVES